MSSFNSDVDVTIGVAFGDDVYETVPTWVDITADVREFSTRRGRSHILDQMQAGEALLTVDNSSGNYNPENTAGTHYPNVKVFNPIRIQAVYNAVTYDLFRGFVEAWTPQAQAGGKDQTVQVKCVDAFRLFAMHEEDLTESAEFTGTRIGNLLDTAGWPAGWRDLDTGNHMVQALSAEFDSVLGQIHRSVLVEQGLFYIAGDGTAVFLDGNTRIQDKASPTATFSDDGNDLRYVDLVLSYDDEQLWNKASVTRVDGTTQSDTDSTSVAAYGQRDLHLSETLHVADGESLALSQWLVMENKDVRVRAPELVVKPEDDPTNLWPKALGLELLDRVNIERAFTGDDLDEDCHVEGVTHDVRMVGGRSWTTSFQLSPALPFDDWWILGTSELGTSTRLGY
jgi:hypothetical protein